MRSTKSLVLAAGATLVLAACGGGSSTTPANTTGAEGALLFNPPARVGSITAADFTASLAAQAATNSSAQLLAGLLQAAGELPVPCGVDFHYLQYNTIGGAGEHTSASGALMVPTGPAGTCSGPRPIVLYAHGTTFEHAYNIADPNTPSNPAQGESQLIAAMFAAQGYIVVAPNYAGYDSSSLSYVPWLNAAQQSQDMIDALAAARSALGHVPASTTTDSGKLFVTGYSAGGHTAMATVRALQAAGAPVTAAAPMSGPYAMEALFDSVVLGHVNVFSTLFGPLITTSYQNSYHNVYNATTDVYSTTYANGIGTLMPTSLTEQQLFQQGKVPLSALFDSTTPVTGNATLDALLAVPSNPLFASGFGNPYLINNSFRLAYAIDAAVTSPDGALPSPPPGAPLAANPMFPFRQDLKKNDLRNPMWAPMEPMLLCGGGNDPTVFFLDTQIMQQFWAPLPLPPGLITVLNVDSAPSGATDPFAALKVGFTNTYGTLVTAEGQQNAIEQYHGLVAPFCTAAAAGFFRNF